MPSIEPVVRAKVWKQFEQDNPQPGAALNDWITRYSRLTGLAEGTIRRIIAEGSVVVLRAMDQRSVSLAQEIAERMGANLSAAFEVLRESYHATKKKVLLDRHGNPKLIDPAKGPVPENMVYIEVPDWVARLMAVRQTVEIFGARAPNEVWIKQQTQARIVQTTTEVKRQEQPLLPPAQPPTVNVQMEVVNLLHMSTEEVLNELARLPGEIERLSRAYTAVADGHPLALGAGEATESGPLN